MEEGSRRANTVLAGWLPLRAPYRALREPLAVAEQRLCLFIEHGVDPAAGPLLHKQMVLNRPPLPLAPTPPSNVT